MKKLVLIVTIICLFIITPKAASAHILATDKNIGGVLHVDPEDDPIVGEQASFFFEFKDKQNQFDPKNCDCTFSILEGGKTIFSQPLFENNANPSLTNASASYTFSQKDVYTIQVTGKPTISGNFQPFTLTYDLRVDRDGTNQSTQNTSWLSQHAVQLGVGIFLCVVVSLITMKKRKVKK